MSALKFSLCLPDFTTRDVTSNPKSIFSLFEEILLPSLVVWAGFQPLPAGLGSARLVALFSGSGVDWWPSGALGGRQHDPGTCEASQRDGTVALQVSELHGSFGQPNHVQLKYVTPGHGLQ